MTLTKTKGAPVAHACGLQAVGYGTGNPLTTRSKPANARESEARVRSGLDLGERDPVRLLAEPIARQPEGDDRVVVRPDRPGVVADRVVAEILARERAHTPTAEQIVGEEVACMVRARSSGTIPDHSRWPRFDVRESMGCLSPSRPTK